MLTSKNLLCTTFEDSNRQSVAKPSETTEAFRFFTFGYSRNDGYFAQRQRIYRTSGCWNSKNLQEPTFSIDTLAEIMCMSRSNFYRKIKGISGMSPNDYLKTIRLKMAAELLLQQEYRINEIYELVGFSSSSYFTKCFKNNSEFPRKNFWITLKTMPEINRQK